MNLFDPIDRLLKAAPLSAPLARLGIHRAVDLLFYFPRSYEEIRAVQTREEFIEGAKVCVAATVLEIGERVTQAGKHMLGLHTATEDGAEIRLLWFNQAFRREGLRVGQRLLVTGKLRSTVLNWEIIQPEVRELLPHEVPSTGQPQPIYALTEGLTQPQLRYLMRDSLPPLIPLVEEALPSELRQRLEVPGIADALSHIHFPPTLDDAQAALRRFKLQELLVLQLAIGMQRRERAQRSSAPACEPTGKIHARILNRLPYQLTADQLKAVEEIGNDMGSSIPMNRLLQGDVGSGKTLVAQYAMLLCVAHGYQSALMAPTEVLAQQHARNLEQSLAASRVRVALLTGSQTKVQRRLLLEKIAAGDVDLVVGTQALLSDEIQWHKLALVIIDEQHKFGVKQRASLRTDAAQPHYLVLSATPIPRTIAMTAFGDLDVSSIRTKPAGRAPVHTYATTSASLEQWWQFVIEQLSRGRQAYVITPRVEEALNAERASAEGIFQKLQNAQLADYSIGLLHGRLPSDEKEAVLSDFAAGNLRVLVATTVVEVGIDVPNATIMTILDADRLGLSQLHQLRGRVSRGTHPGYVCAVAAATEKEVSERLQAFASCSDGFELAELDLRLRGPGDLLGTSQSGLATLRVANLIEDQRLVERARASAVEILHRDPGLSDPQLSRLVQQTLRRYGHAMQLSNVG
jgi:ATP-dependent DNA helicase RecG